jgi:hypothetical protein
MRLGSIAAALGVASILISCSSDNPTEPPQQQLVSPSDTGVVYVDATADGGTADGSLAHPYARIQPAIDRAYAHGQRNVLVASGTYAGSLTLRDKVSVRGGYDPATWTRLGAPPSIVEGNTTAITTGGADSLDIENLTIRSASASAPGSSSIGILINGGSSGVVVASNHIEAGAGADGAYVPIDDNRYEGYQAPEPGKDAGYASPTDPGGPEATSFKAGASRARGGTGGSGGGAGRRFRR